MQQVANSQVYHPRQPLQFPLWQLLNNHLNDFELNYDERCVRLYGYPRQVVRDVVADYLDYGDLRQGFARIRCPVERRHPLPGAASSVCLQHTQDHSPAFQVQP